MGKSRTSGIAKTSSGIGLGGGGLVGGGGGGGGASTSASTSASANVQAQPSASATTVQQMQQTLANNVNAPTIQALGNNIDVSAFSQMSDDQLAQIISQSQKVDLPNQLNDVSNEMQKFTYYAGLNTKPDVLDDSSFRQYMSDNGISRSEILSRSVSSGTYKLPSGATVPLSAKQIADMYMYSDSHYVGGKQGGSVHGYGGYFALTGGGSTGYGSHTISAVLSKNAKTITETNIASKWASFANAHPKANSAMNRIRDTDSRQNMQAILMGYNVIKCTGGHSSYRVILDRSALVFHE